MEQNRLDNISWTVAEDYSKPWNEQLFPQMDFYTAALRGAIAKYYCSSTIDAFLNRFVLKQNNRKELLSIAKILLEELVTQKLIGERPGLEEKRELHIRRFYEELPSRKLLLDREIELCYYKWKQGQVPTASPLTWSLVKDILSFQPKKTGDTMEVLHFLKLIYDKYFHICASLPPDEKESYDRFTEKKEHKSAQHISTHPSQLLKEEDLEKFHIGSAEFSEVEQEDASGKIQRDDISSPLLPRKNIYRITQKHYGKEILPRYKVQQMEREISTGIHEKIHLYFSGGEFEEENSYFQSRIEENYKENTAYYNKNFLIYERGIRKLMTTIKNSLLEENEESEIRSDTGNIVAKDLWKYFYLGEEKIFQKKQKCDSKDLYVDILLDSSASQEERKSQVAAECYIIASALTRLKIKTRVLGFNNFYNYLIIQKFRDYHDSEVKNTEIFRYTPSGSNRDGMAIKLMRHLSEQNHDQRRILIILSDGKPNDEIHLNIIGAQSLEGENYVDEQAILDTAKEVLLTKLKKIHTFGVFTGEEEDIEKIKKIYGTDFAYITDLSRFHDIVGIFLKTFSQKILD